MQASINCADAKTASRGRSQFCEAELEEFDKIGEFKAHWRPFLSIMPYIPCIDSQAEAIVGKVLLIVEIELNSRDETCEAGQFEQTRPEADGKKILAC